MNILVVQTAFLGDVVLTLPMVQVVKRQIPEAKIHFVAVPRAAEVLRNHPAVDEVIEFDKRGVDRGVKGLMRLAELLRKRKYDVALVPHRSLRSAVLVWRAKIPTRVGFDRSAGRFLLNRIVPYRSNAHEIERNLSLLRGLDVSWNERELPGLFPSAGDAAAVDRVLEELGGSSGGSLIAMAPGTVWNTKRWLKERFAEVVLRFADEGSTVVLIGGREDRALCDEIVALTSRNQRVINVAGKLSLLQSAELIRRCRLLVCNDSAPMHLAAAVRTPVVAIFGATVPEFGFAPYGERDIVVEKKGLPCRPCTIHGGDRCPIRTFVCMNDITTDVVYRSARRALGKLETTA